MPELINQHIPTAADIVAASNKETPADTPSQDNPPAADPPEPKTREPKARVDPIDVDDDDPDDAVIDDPADPDAEDDPTADDEDPPDPDGDEADKSSFQAPKVKDYLERDPTGQKLQRRLNDAYKGLEKKDKQNKEREQSINGLVDYGNRLITPTAYKPALKEILSEAAGFHGVQPAELLAELAKELAPGLTLETKKAPAQAAHVSESDDEETLTQEAKALGLEHWGDVKAVRKAVALAKANTEQAVADAVKEAVKTTLESLGASGSEMKDAIKVIKESQASKESAAWVERSAAFIINRAAKGEDSFHGVTKEMVAKAHEQYPDLPARELVAKLPNCFPREFRNSGTKAAKKGPEIIHGGRPQGNGKIPNKHPGDFTFGDLVNVRK